VLPIAFRSIGMDGRLVTAGAHAGPNVSIDFSYLYHKRITIKGRPGYTPEDVPDCLTAAAEGKVMPQIDRVLPLSHAAEAHRLIEENGGQGKIVLDPTLG
jgi:NADPH:quinone reductase-like Zn-dependent oxidoreductase